MPLLATAIYSNFGLYLRTLTLTYESISWMVIERDSLKSEGSFVMKKTNKLSISTSFMKYHTNSVNVFIVPPWALTYLKPPLNCIFADFYAQDRNRFQ
jgi:hypothetical protein